MREGRQAEVARVAAGLMPDAWSSRGGAPRRHDEPGGGEQWWRGKTTARGGGALFQWTEEEERDPRSGFAISKISRTKLKK